MTEENITKAVPDPIEGELVAKTLGRIMLTLKHVKIVGLDNKAKAVEWEFKRELLANHWADWDDVQSALKKLDPPVTQAELDALSEVPDGPGGRNGYKELCSAIKTIHSV